MSPRIVLSIAFLCGMAGPAHLTLAAEPGAPTYSLDEILAVALAHSPTLAGAEGLVKQSQGQQVSAGAYPNPSVSGTAGRGAIRDPSTGTRITERTVTVEQPLEWTGKRQARQDAANAGAAGASAALEETRLGLSADVKIAFYSVLFAQRDADLAVQHVGLVDRRGRGLFRLRFDVCVFTAWRPMD